MPQEARKIAHHAIFGQRLSARPHDQQARGIAGHGRMKGNAVLWQVEIEINRTHGL